MVFGTNGKPCHDAVSTHGTFVRGITAYTGGFVHKLQVWARSPISVLRFFLSSCPKRRALKRPHVVLYSALPIPLRLFLCMLVALTSTIAPVSQLQAKYLFIGASDHHIIP